MNDEPLSFEKHRREREENSVRCAHCGRWILATAIRCPECGIRFEGEAQDFTHPSQRGRRPRRSLLLIAAALLALLAILAGLFAFR